MNNPVKMINPPIKIFNPANSWKMNMAAIEAITGSPRGTDATAVGGTNFKA